MITVSGAAPAAVPMLPVDHGLIAWTVPIDYATASSLLSVEASAGTLRLTRIRRVPAGPATNIVIYVQTAGATLSNCFAALYTAAGSLVGQTADQSTPWQSVGVKTMAISGGPISIPAGDYYAGLWYNGTTAPTVLRSGMGSNGPQANLGQSDGNYNTALADTGLAATAPSNIGTQTRSALRWWAALS